MERWPEPFRVLFRKFAQINAHLTFLTLHLRSTIPTYELLHKLNADISTLDLGLITALFPTGDVVYEYVDENQVMLSFAESLQHSWSRGYTQHKPSTVDQAYEEAFLAQEASSSRQLLIFEFRDAKIHGVGSVMHTGAKKRRKMQIKDRPQDGFFLASKDLKMDTLSREQLLNIIRARNAKFQAEIDDFLASFEGEDPMKALIEKASALVPQPPEFLDPVESMEGTQSSSVDSEKPTLDEMVNVLKEKGFYKHQIVALETLTPSRKASCGTLPVKEEFGVPHIHPDLVQALWDYKGIALQDGLYSHQAEALKALMYEENPKHVIVSTSTSSGKSLIYQIPVLNDILWDISNGINTKRRSTTAIFIFPTKALAQDQKRHIQDLINHLPTLKRKIIVDTYDGDTESKSRTYIRNYADIIFTNPDTIHASILPQHESSAFEGRPGWPDFLLHLKYVVVDELHVYKGTFGVHVSYVMARLNRIKAKLNAEDTRMDHHGIQYISCSATISNPASHFRAVCSIPKNDSVVHISEDGSPCSERKLVVWNPPPLMNKRGETQRQLESSAVLKEGPINKAFVPRENIIPELARVLVQLLTKLPTIKVILFCTIRTVCELMMKEIRSLISSSTYTGSLSEHDVMSYRGGYSKADRRKIEIQMFSGQLRAIVATNALELGIDLSELDVVITAGFPILKLNLHQQFGRAGRSTNSKGSLAIYVGSANPIDQYYIRNPLKLCDKDNYEDLCVEGLIDSGLSQLIMELHLQCAAFEWPVSLAEDVEYFVPSGSNKISNVFVKLCQNSLYKDNNGKYRTSPQYLPWPAEHVAIRAIEETSFAVVDVTNGRNKVIEEVEALRTSFTLYEGGIFLHQGLQYLVKEFNSKGCYAKVERVKVDWITLQRDFTDVDPSEVEYVKCLQSPRSETASDVPAFFGKIEITTVVFGYFKVNRRGELLEAVEVNNPPVKFHSKGFWIDIPRSALEVIEEKGLSAAGGIHAAQHAIMNILALFINGGATTNGNARWSSNIGESELKTECKAPEKEFAKRQSNRKRPARLVFYDAKGGSQGLGVSAKTFEHIDEIIDTAYTTVSECECDWGCPLCVTAGFCKEMLLVMSKPAAAIILGALVGVDLEQLREQVRDGPEENMPTISVETILSTSASVRFSKDVEIISVRRASRPLAPLMKREERETIKAEIDIKGKVKDEVKEESDIGNEDGNENLNVNDNETHALDLDLDLYEV